MLIALAFAARAQRPDYVLLHGAGYEDEARTELADIVESHPGFKKAKVLLESLEKDGGQG